jgi:hypothetical protein
MSCVRWGEEGERRLVVHHGRPRKKKGDGNEGADSAMTGGKEKGGGPVRGRPHKGRRGAGGWQDARPTKLGGRRRHTAAQNRRGRVTDRWGPGYRATRFESVRPGQSDSNGLNQFQTNFKSIQNLTDPNMTLPGV